MLHGLMNKAVSVGKWVERLLECGSQGFEFLGWVKSKNEKLAPAASLVSVLEQNWLAQCQFKMTGWSIILICGMVL